MQCLSEWPWIKPKLCLSPWLTCDCCWWKAIRPTYKTILIRYKLTVSENLDHRDNDWDRYAVIGLNHCCGCLLHNFVWSLLDPWKHSAPTKFVANQKSIFTKSLLGGLLLSHLVQLLNTTLCRCCRVLLKRKDLNGLINWF